MKRAKVIYTRYGVPDVIISPEDELPSVLKDPDYYQIGYEDEHGNECYEDGEYLDQNLKLPEKSHWEFDENGDNIIK